MSVVRDHTDEIVALMVSNGHGLADSSASQWDVVLDDVYYIVGCEPSGWAKHRQSVQRNSNRAFKHAELADLLARKSGEVDLVDDQGRTPLMHAVGTGLLDVAKALVAAGADTLRESVDGRNIANRCHGSSGMVRRWVDKGLKVRPRLVQVESRYRGGWTGSVEPHVEVCAEGGCEAA